MTNEDKGAARQASHPVDASQEPMGWRLLGIGLLGALALSACADADDAPKPPPDWDATLRICTNGEREFEADVIRTHFRHVEFYRCGMLITKMAHDDMAEWLCLPVSAHPTAPNSEETETNE